MSSKEDVIKFLNEQVDVEKKIVKSLNESLPEIVNPTVKGVLKGISLDSEKHAELYASAVRLLNPCSEASTHENPEKQKNLIEKHMQIEAGLIEKLNKMLQTVKDSRIKLLLNTILKDETEHHKLMKDVLHILAKEKTVTEVDWWDRFWKDVGEGVSEADKWDVPLEDQAEG